MLSGLATGVKQEWASNPYAMEPVLEFNRRLVDKAAALSAKSDSSFTAQEVELALFAAEHGGGKAKQAPGGSAGRDSKKRGLEAETQPATKRRRRRR